MLRSSGGGGGSRRRRCSDSSIGGIEQAKRHSNTTHSALNAKSSRVESPSERASEPMSEAHDDECHSSLALVRVSRFSLFISFVLSSYLFCFISLLYK